jgi:single-stranded DNA-binding protein
MRDDITATVTGVIANDPTMRTTRDSKPWASFTVLVHVGADKAWISVALFGDSVSEVAPKLMQGRRVAVAGRLTLRRWVGNDGRDKAGLALAATEVELLAADDRKPPHKRSRTTDPRVPFTTTINTAGLTAEQMEIPSFE